MQAYKFFISIIYDSYAPGLLCSMFSILCGVSKFITSNASFGTFSSIALTIQHLPSREVPLCVQVFRELPLTISWFDKILACGSCDFVRKKTHIVVFSITVGTTSSRNVPSSKYNKVIFKHISFVFSMFFFFSILQVISENISEETHSIAYLNSFVELFSQLIWRGRMFIIIIHLHLGKKKINSPVIQIIVFWMLDTCSYGRYYL